MIECEACLYIGQGKFRTIYKQCNTEKSSTDWAVKMIENNRIVSAGHASFGISNSGWNFDGWDFEKENK